MRQRISRPAAQIILLSLLSIAVFAQSEPAAEPRPPVLAPPASPSLDLLFPEPTPATALYRELGRRAGWNVLFDPKLRERKLAIELRDVAPLRALEMVAAAGGHFFTVLDERSLIVADDTPQNRRSYEPQTIQTIALENLEIADAMTMARSLYGVKHITAHHELNAVVVRDDADTVRLVERLLRAYDRPRSEVAITVELWGIDGDELAALALPESEGDGVPMLLSLAELQRLRALPGARALARPKIRILEGDEGAVKIGSKIPLPGGDAIRYGDLGLELRIAPRVHADAGEVTLDLDFGLVTLAGRGEQRVPVLNHREIASSVRLAAGQSYLLSGLVYAGDTLPILPLDDLEAGRDEIVLILTPRIARATGFAEEDLEALWIGTETQTVARVSGR